MTPFARAYTPQEQYDQIFRELWAKWLKADPDIRASFPQATAAEAYGAMTAFLKWSFERPTFRNDLYQVTVFDDGHIVHLSIKRNDRAPIHDWRDLQEIKNQLVGAENEAIEIYPAESKRVDSANQYHLWVFKDPTYRIPIGFQTRLVSEDTIGLSQQRPFENAGA